jgi:four helix bundle protein
MAFEHAMVIFQLSRKWPAEERFSLTDQIRRCTRSVCANIAEGWRKRRYAASFVSKFSDADTEAGETLVWLDFARECGYLSAEDQLRLSQTYDHICAQLVTMINQSDKWCLP